jgi:nitrogen fixation NifU-like protein
MRFSPQIVEHFTNPVNPGEIEDADVRAFIGNPVCGDQILITARVDGDKVTEARFLAYGCSASLGTASILAASLPGRAPSEVAEVTVDDVIELVGDLAPDQRHCAELGVDVLKRFAANAASGVNDEGPLGSCISTVQ